MKVVAALLCILALSGMAAGAEESPVARVAKLMQDLSDKIDQDEKAEQKLYDAFICWGETTITTKTQSNSDAQSRIQSLESYVGDLDGGKVELTDERETLEAQLKQLNGDLTAMKNQRDAEHTDFMSASKEMKQALAAMGKALDVLSGATKGHTQGVLMQNEAHEASTFSAQQAEAETLTYAADLGDKFLSHRDAVFLRRILTGDVPNVDWKKVNRKANFKKSYKARSFNIQTVLQKMDLTFQRNLADAEAKEEESQKQFETLFAAKTSQRDQTQTAYENLDEEKGAQAASRQDSMDEINALTTQVENDKKFIAQVQEEIQQKKVEWSARMNLRAGEKEALAQAVSIIRSDDAKDLFKKSLASDDEVFLQVSQQSGLKMVSKSAAEVLESVAQKAGDKRLALLASRVAATSGAHFEAVIRSLDEMVQLLQGEENSDLDDKETCEKNRKDDTRDSALDARHIDDLSDQISKLQAEIAELESSIAANKDQIKKTNEELEQATEMRKEQQAEWESNNRDDTNAAALVKQARDVLASYYEKNNMFSLSQTKAKGAKGKDAPEMSEAGDAPMPPPSTWETPYGGKTGESKGILAILETIEQDIQKDKAKAAAENDEAKAAYAKMKQESLNQINELNTSNSELEANVADKQESVTFAKQQQKDTKASLDNRMEKMNDEKKHCDFVLVNYEMRVENRHLEMDGLLKAKAILSGATFDAPDKNREIKPGDAFLSMRRKQ